LPNRFIAIVEKNDTELDDFGKKIEEAVREEFEAIASKIMPEAKDAHILIIPIWM
jgi:predicted phage-related endonuclease